MQQDGLTGGVKPQVLPVEAVQVNGKFMRKIPPSCLFVSKTLLVSHGNVNKESKM